MTDEMVPERALPANPNCVCFAAEATAVLAGRSWADVLRAASRITLPFHQDSGLACTVGFSWRVQLDRKNRRSLMVLLYFVFDGPATSAHLDTLERAVRDGMPGFGPGSIERVPANGGGALLVADGLARLLLHRDRRTGHLFLRHLAFEDGKVRPDETSLERAGAELAPPELPKVVGVPAPYGEAERETERMRLAFALRFTRRIVEADGVVRPNEAEFVDKVFPSDLVGRLGLDEPRARDEYFEAARSALPVQLGHHDKLALVGLFFSACYSDGSLDAREMRVLKEAGEMLGLSREDVVKFLRRFW